MSKIENIDMKTPAYIINEGILLDKCNHINYTSQLYGMDFYYSLKAFNNLEILRLIYNKVDGFSVSSLFEAKLVREFIDSTCKVHCTSPGIDAYQTRELYGLCNYISFNSIEQWRRNILTAVNNISPGLRINPKLSFVDDERYDPCSKNSKLGVSIDKLSALMNSNSKLLNEIHGIHLHTNSESDDFFPLLNTIEHIESSIKPLLNKIKWINLGGGYYFDKKLNYEPLAKVVDKLKSKYNLEVTIEPGAAVVQESGSLVCSIIDIFKSDSKKIVILDTTVNHLPEVLEFQYQPEIEEGNEEGKFEYILAGSSCLAGDKFGTYRFGSPLKVGDCITFVNVGAYSLVKAHMFNGINLPSVYLETENGQLELLKEYTYEDFLNRCGANFSESLRKRA